MEFKLDDTPARSVDHERYEVVRKLGEGGAGIVYLVRDRETGEQLAWKGLQRTDETSIARLKREFRTLSAINHKNVIRLYDLGRVRNEWFLTMEYLDGQTLLDHFENKASISITLRRSAAAVDVAPIDLDRIVRVFQELATGVHALHHHGVLHRDLKPSNVIVERGRVVVLDFGLALEVGDAAATVTMDGAIAGTPAYMAPEQLLGKDWGEPNDWYAFGVMLYEALTGVLPIEGRVHQLLQRKLDQDAVPVERRVKGLPSALTGLCNALLQRQPERRPTGAEVVAVLDALVSTSQSPAAANDPQASVPRVLATVPDLFGRDSELSELGRAYSEVAQGGAAVVHVLGASGAGKSALVERFLEELEQIETVGRDRVMILRGRCYERETVPFKALDAVLDALVTQLSREHDIEVSHVLPSEVQALTLLFPVLMRLSVVQQLLRPSTPTFAKPQAREAAESALRDLFSRIAARGPLLIWIDDLHWGDVDSVRILRGWLGELPIPGMMLVLSYRGEEIATSPCLRALAERQKGAVSEHALQLDGLHQDHIRALCEQRLASAALAPDMRREIVEHIVSEADGSPFLASQLSVLALSELHGKPIDAPEVLTIESLVGRRTALLSQRAKQLLCVLAVAGRPLSMRMALQLSGTGTNARAIVHELSGLGLIRSQSGDGERQLAVYHDRLREAVLVSLRPAERAQCEHELLSALEGEPDVDPAWLHTLALACGRRELALHHGLLAAAQAQQALAFERAAQLYQECLALCADPSPECLDVWQKLALALGHAGRGRQAATAYQEAALRASGTLRLKLERAAASHLLRSGAFGEGEALILKVLAELKLSTPGSPAGLLAAIGWEHARLSLRSLDIDPAACPTETDPDVLFKAELCGTLSVELQPYDPLRAALFQARSLRLALDFGTSEHIARAFCVAATMAAVSGGRSGHQRAQVLLERATQLALSHRSVLVEGNIASARAVCAMLRADLPGTVEHSGEAERMFRQASSSDDGEYYHRFTVLTARLTALFEHGQHEIAMTELKHVVNEARATENIGALLLLSSVVTRADLLSDQATRSMPRLEAEHAQLPPQRFGLLHVYYLCSVMRVGCATGDHAWARHWMHDEYERMEGSVLKRGGPFAVIAAALHARLLLNRAVATHSSAAEAERTVARDLSTLTKLHSPAVHAVIARTHARLALLAGDRSKAHTLLERSQARFVKIAAREEAARDEYALGKLLGGERGAQLQAAAIAELRARGYVNPHNDLRAYYPELLD